MFFVIGRGRSGTSLLGRFLDGHPDVFVAPESLFVLNVLRRYSGADFDPPTVRRLVRDIWREERMRRWKVDRRALEEHLLSCREPGLGLARLCALVYEASAEAHGSRAGGLLGDKNPHYALFVRELMALFPSARFLHLVRDYRDNVLSYREVPFDLSSTPALAVRWRRYNEAILQAAMAEEERFHRLRFEDLVSRPETVLQGVCAFLGVAFDPLMVESRQVRQEDRLPWHANLGGPLDRNLLHKWRRGMTRQDVLIADRICQPLGELFGYRPASGEPVPLPWRARGGVALGSAVTGAERLLFRLPVELRATAIRAYRVATGNRIS